jgi:hypothetical protein
VARGIWLALDARFLADPRIRKLVRAHGPAGGLLVIALLAEAKQQGQGGRAHVATDLLSMTTGIPEDTIEAIVADAEKHEALELVHSGDGEITVAFPKWGEWQKDVTNAERQARHRAKQSVTCNGSNDSVTPTGQDRTGEQTASSGKPDTEAEVITKLCAYWQEQCDHQKANVGPKTARYRKVRARLRDGYTPRDIATAIQGAARAPFINDEGKKFDDLELICRNAEKLEDFRSRAEQRPKGGGTDYLAELSARAA